LPKPNIDTGMGLERLAVVIQGVDNLFEVDTVKNVMAAISEVVGVKYKENENTDISLRVITDHIRSTVMMVSDGVIPSNEGRGYVLRRLLRRAARHGKILGTQKPFLFDIADTVIDESKSAYPELEEKRDYIKKIIKIEEQNFDKTIDNGLSILSEYIAELKKSGKKVLDGDKTFKLYDTYGFPIDLTTEILAENGMTADEEGFKEQMLRQRTTARNSRKDGSSWDSDETGKIIKNYTTDFVGYTNFECDSEISALIADGEECSVLSEGDEGMIVTGKTVFYGEGGGQIGDTGVIRADMGRAEVVDTKKFADGKVYVHHVRITGGEFKKGDKVTLKIDKERRKAISRNHSSTHLMHKALKEVLGSHVGQAGSYVSDERLRFDFSHFEAMTNEELALVEEKVNGAILAGLEIKTEEMPAEEAKKTGATAQFGEKYGDIVRVVSMGDYSIEFCGGCHLTNTAQAGLFKILSESGVAAGTRRIEAVTGSGVLKYIKDKDNIIERTAEILKTKPSGIDKKAESVINEYKETKKALDSLKSKMAAGKAADIMSGMHDVGGVNVLCARLDGTESGDIRKLGDSIKEKLGCGIFVAAGENDAKITFIAMATKEAVGKGVHAGNIIREITKAAGGSGGGKPDTAQGGGRDASKIDDALAMVDELVKNQLK
ncbi:MAG: alanine--tRNA ligase, partial [Oscillospiraceae bacterium]|nr:alanine--tRNA ligase [Oscillospiraceae bacterium]